MDTLAEVAPQLETPTKPKLKKRATPMSRSLVREIDMPARPPCVDGSAGNRQIVHMYVKPNSRGLRIRVDCVDWLVSYAADEHYYKGVPRCEAAATEPQQTYTIDWSFDHHLFECNFFRAQ
jgi:hypothetical protein